VVVFGVGRAGGLFGDLSDFVVASGGTSERNVLSVKVGAQVFPCWYIVPGLVVVQHPLVLGAFELAQVVDTRILRSDYAGRDDVRYDYQDEQDETWYPRDEDFGSVRHSRRRLSEMVSERLPSIKE